MGKRVPICIVVLGSLLAPALFSDQVTLKNGDTITGTIDQTIEHKDGKKLTVTSEYLGEVTIPWTAVASIKSNTPLVVVLDNGKESKGVVTTRENNLVVQTPGQPVTAPISQVTTIRGEAEQRNYEKLLSPSWLNLWTGYFDLGFALARGNARTDTLATVFTASRTTRTDKTTVLFNQIYSTATLDNVSGTTANAVGGGISYDRSLTPRLFLNVFNTYLHDEFQDLNLRFVIGGGLGYHVIKGERLSLDLLAGADYNRENFTDLTRNSAEIYWGDDLSYKISGITSLTQSFRMYNNMSDLGAYRFGVDIGAVTTLRKWLSWQLTASDRYLSTPVLGRKPNDILLTTGLRVSFGRDLTGPSK